MENADSGVWPFKVRFIFLITALVVLLSGAVCSQTASQQVPAKASPAFLDRLQQDAGTPGLAQEFRRLQNTGRLMMVVAHPDDEDGGLLTLESRGKGVQTLLLTLTRGEGGQNKTGDTFSDQLGILRTLELLAADRYYGVEQRFTRVADFGYSKTPEETFQKWGGHEVPLQDIVRVIREFRPDVLIARFSGTDRDGHGHHQASAILTKEAFRAAADPDRFPEQIKAGLQPWQPRKLYIGNVCGFRASTCPDENWTVKLNTGEEDPVLGMSYSQFAIEGLRHQESQGLGDISMPSGPRYAFYKLADSVLPKTTDANGHETDLFDGIDTSLSGLAATVKNQESRAEIKEAVQKIAEAVKGGAANASSAVTPLLSALRCLDADAGIQGKDPDQQTALVKTRGKEKQLQSAINLALNVELQAVMISPPSDSGGNRQITAVSPGQEYAVKATFRNGSQYPVQLNDLTIDGMITDHGRAVDDRVKESRVAPGQNYEHIFRLRLPETNFTKPGFHRDDPQRQAVYTVEQPQLIPLPFASMPAAVVHAQYAVPGMSSNIPDKSPNSGLAEISAPVTVSISNPRGDQWKEKMAIVPAFSVAIQPGDQVVPASTTSPVGINVRVGSDVDGVSGVLRLQAPPGSKVSPPQQQVSLAHRGEEQTFQFKLSLPSTKQGEVPVRAVLSSAGKQYSESYTLVTREDLGSFYYFQPAVQHISLVDVKVPHDFKVGYIMGAGDDIPSVLQQIGMQVTIIPADNLAAENLSRYGTIVLGVRAYDTQKAVVENNKKLLDYVSNGGTLIVQNNNSVGDFNNGHFTPYPAELSRARVSVEDAPVQILDPDNKIFHYPNEITQKDFDGWVQERGLYFMSSWDDHFKPLLSCHDPNEPDQKGGLLVAKYGKGTYIYTGYAFFRQLPAGVPGAIRLFVNLVSAGRGAERPESARIDFPAGKPSN
jgi:LmbE family N-acetylglucosaminyl deacetylase